MIHHARMVAEIEIRSRLIHDDDPGVLRQCARNERQLSLSPGNARVNRVRERSEPQALERRLRDVTIFARG